MPTDAPDGLINQHAVVGSAAKARKAAKPAEPKKAPDDDTAASKPAKAK
jgi:hypothetical protein